MGLLQNPDPAIKLARQYGIRGIFTPEIVPSLQPVVLIDDLTGGISNEPQRIGTVLGAETGVNAEFTVFRFETPPDVIAQITRVLFNPESNGVVDVSFGSTVAAPAQIHTSVYTDGRLRSKGQAPACVMSSDTFGAIALNPSIRLPANATNQLIDWQEVNWIIGRTDGAFDFMEMALQTLNLNMTVCMQWTEFTAREVR